MKTILTVATVVVAFYVAAPAFAQNSPVKAGDYYAQSTIIRQQPTAQELNRAKEGDYYAPDRTAVQRPTVQELNQAKEGDYYAAAQR